MSSQDNRPKTAREDDDDYGDDLDLELERVIKRLDEATSDNPAPPPIQRQADPRPPLTARSPVPARDPFPAADDDGAEAPAAPAARKVRQEGVIDLVDEIDDQAYPEPDEYDDPSRSVVSMTADELVEAVARGVELGLRRFYSR